MKEQPLCLEDYSYDYDLHDRIINDYDHVDYDSYVHDFDTESDSPDLEMISDLEFKLAQRFADAGWSWEAAVEKAKLEVAALEATCRFVSKAEKENQAAEEEKRAAEKKRLREEKDQRLLESLCELFLKKGYEREEAMGKAKEEMVRIGEIAAGSGAGKG
jgi:hypothetical protein